MSKAKQQIAQQVAFLNRLEQLSSTYSLLIDFLKQHSLISKDELVEMNDTPVKAKFLQQKLDSLLKQERVQLLEYDWKVLPVEILQLTIVTDKEVKVFSAEL